jgi:NAD(P)-dependent dehydrogenase (short-subunit alcohol dehydrogenase family)
MTDIDSSSTVLVTGATSGIGQEVARQLAAAGHQVWVGARSAEKGRHTVGQLGDATRFVVLDVTAPAAIAAAVAQLDQLDILVNNAGISPDAAAAPDATVEAFRQTYETNVFGVVAVTNAFLPLLRRSMHPRIVNVSSGTGSLAWSTGPNPQFDHTSAAGGAAAYRSSKTALNALTVFYAQALAADGFKVNALAPGLRATNLNARAAASGNDPGEAAAEAVRLALLPDDGPTGRLFSWDGTPVPW